MNFYFVTLSMFCAVVLSSGEETTIPPTAGEETTIPPTAGEETTIPPTAGEETTIPPTAGKETTIAPPPGNHTMKTKPKGKETTIAPPPGNHAKKLSVKPKGKDKLKNLNKKNEDEESLLMADTKRDKDHKSKDSNKKNEDIESLLMADTKRDTDDDDSSGLNKKFDENESLLKADTKHATIMPILNPEQKTKSNSVNSGYDSSSSFPLIFMVSFVIIVGGYFLYHKKSKILGFLLEGAPSSARRKAGYKKVKNVEDVMSGVGKHDA
ncbi:mucin-22-like isoform X6 [Hydra vulgaris]|uniref:Mucin-22-like isoform X2 n=1 Tax=Hydra vulgaris TaxID=6087 RepID=A0ABM4D6Q6_HYDVU